jgi:trehalose 6-phosphate synthase
MPKSAPIDLCDAQGFAEPPLDEGCALFLDVDGTLVPIASTPEKVRVEPGLRATLDHLRKIIPVALISGRRLADIDKLFAPLRLPAAGTHGLERRRADGTLERAPVGGFAELIRPALTAFAETHPGIRLEDKGLSLALHWRLAPEHERAALNLAERLARTHPQFRLVLGKMVAELAPRGNDKGGAIEAFLAEPPFAGRRAVFLGDDITDEDGFVAVERLGGVGVLIGERPETAAQWRLGSVEAVHEWLARAEERLAASARAPQMTTVPPPQTAPRPHRPAIAPAEGRLVVVSNRVALPGKASAGGLAVGVLDALQRTGGLWFGWSGEHSASAELRRAEHGSVTFATTDVERGPFEAYYNGFSNRVLWPICHFRTGLVEFRREDLDGYLHVNRVFAERLKPTLREGDRIWVQDYHLIPFGEELRRLGVTQPMGFFLHIPLPPPDLWRIVPCHRDLMRALCAYDLVGFQTRTDADAFRDYLVREAGGRDHGEGVVRAFDRTVRIGVFPIGVDAGKLAAMAASAVGNRTTERLRRSLVDRSLIIGVDRLDYSKGLLARFEAFGHLLEAYPEVRDHVTFMQIAPPSRSDVPEYSEIRSRLEAMAGHINGHHAEFDWTPIRYLNRSFNQKQLAAFYRIARIGLVTPLRDGMNLVAKEYVACQDPEDPGMLVLSCFAGAARELADAVIVNPFDVQGMADEIHRALTMPLDERRERWLKMRDMISRNDIAAWRENFLRSLAEAR